jgi:hypothetical protein
VRYLLLAALCGAAFAQDPSFQNPETGRTLAGKADRLKGAIEASSSGADNRSTNFNLSPVLLQDVTRRPVQWTMRTTVCPLITSDVTGSGQGRTTVTLVRNADGTFNYKIADEVSGPATDGNNKHYIFLYTNTSFVDSGIPRQRAPYNVYGTDYFQLIPTDGGAAYTTHIFFKLRINADGSFVDQGSAFTPNAFCDPI